MNLNQLLYPMSILKPVFTILNTKFMLKVLQCFRRLDFCADKLACTKKELSILLQYIHSSIKYIRALFSIYFVLALLTVFFCMFFTSFLLSACYILYIYTYRILYHFIIVRFYVTLVLCIQIYYKQNSSFRANYNFMYLLGIMCIAFYDRYIGY